MRIKKLDGEIVKILDMQYSSLLLRALREIAYLAENVVIRCLRADHSIVGIPLHALDLSDRCIRDLNP